MSMHPEPIPTIPEETIRVAQSVLPKGNGWMQMRDALGTVYADEDFTDLCPSRGQPAEAPWRLALVTIMHYAEGLTDRQAALAVRTRIAWKYVATAWNEPMPGVIARCSRTFEVACSPREQNAVCSMCSWSTVANVAGGIRPRQAT